MLNPVRPIQASNDAMAAKTQTGQRRTSGPSAASKPRSTPPAPTPSPAKK